MQTIPTSWQSHFWRGCVAVSILLIAAPVVVRGLWLTGVDMWMWVRPPSLPRGIYLAVETDSLHTGDIAFICVPGAAGRLALQRQYVRASGQEAYRCAPGEAPMAKILAGLPGDTVLVRQDSVKINSRDWLRAPMRPTDSEGRYLPAWIGTTVLGRDECFALSLWSPLSYDSRYFGPFPCPPTPTRIAHPVSAKNQHAIDSLRMELRGRR